MKSSTLIIWLLFAAFCAVDLAIVGEIQLRKNEWPEAGGVFGIGFVIGQVPLVALWFVWGGASIFVRGITTLAGIYALACVGSYSEHGAPRAVDEWLGILLIQLACLSIPFAIARTRQFQLRCVDAVAHNSNSALPLESAKHQVTIWWLLCVTTLVAVLISVLRLVSIPIDDLFDAAVFIAVLSAPSCVTLLLAFAMQRLWVSIVVACLLFPLASFAFSLITGSPHERIEFLLTFCLQGGIVAIAIVTLRNAGFRLEQSHHAPMARQSSTPPASARPNQLDEL